jgi:hypothetical protein
MLVFFAVGWSLEDVEKLVVEAKKDVNNRNVHAHNAM